MLALRILDLKDFTGKLFIGDVFNHFYFVEAYFTTFLTHTLDGQLQKDFFDNEKCTKNPTAQSQDNKRYCL